MARVPLSDTSGWELTYEDQDVRGFGAIDADGQRVGEIDQMIVNTDEQRVDAVVLDDGTEYPARDIAIGDGVVYLAGSAPNDVDASVTVFDDYGRVVERENVTAPPYDDYADDFRSHYRNAYAGTGNDYATYDPAYRYGYEAALDDRYRGRDYNTVEPDLRKGYVHSHDQGMWDRTKDAVRHAYDSVRRSV